MSDIKSRIQQDLTTAMKARQQREVAAIRLITAAIKQQEVDQRITADDNLITDILVKLAKQRRESITQYQQAGRDDLVEQEQYELALIETYLPQPLTPSEIENLVQQALSETKATSIKDMGAVMAILKPKIHGRADMGQVSNKVKQALA
jgi:uncharacterized protein YqeY